MKSSQLVQQSSSLVASSFRVRKGFAAIFAGALALGLGAGSVIAQGPYYPGTFSPPADQQTLPFLPSGIPIVTSPEFNLIENSLVGGATLVTPPAPGKHTASAAEYNAGVAAAATTVANGGGGSVSIPSLTVEVTKYRSNVNQVTAALGSLANGIIASGSGTKQTQLEQLSFSAAQANPGGFGLANTILSTVFQNVANANNAPLYLGINGLVAQALAGAATGANPAAPFEATGVLNVVSNAATAVVNSATPAALSGSNKLISFGNVVDSVSSSMVVSGTLANLDAATNALGSGTNTSVINLTNLVQRIKTQSGALAQFQLGAIAQGALRQHHAAGDYGAIATGLSVAPLSYAYDVIYSYQDLVSGIPAGTVAATRNPAAVAAASGTYRNAAGTAADVVSILNSGAGPFPGAANDIIGRATGANQGADITIATAVVGAMTPAFVVLYPALTVGAITYDTVLDGFIGHAGSIAGSVVQTRGASLTVADAGDVAKNAVLASSASATATNLTNAFSDISYQLGVKLKTKPLHSVQAVTDAVKQIAMVDQQKRTYIAVIAQLVGDGKTNYTAILNAGLAAEPAYDDAAITSGAVTYNGLTNNPLNNYQWTLTNIAPANTNDQNLAVGYAAALGNSSDAAGALAALIGNTNTPVADLTQAAINANRGKQAVLAAASDVAVHVKANPNDIQAYLGARILDNPTAIDEVTTAATVVAPQYSHFIAHTLTYNAPTVAYGVVSNIYLHSKISYANPAGVGPNAFGVVGPKANFVNDRPAAAAAITAGLTTGLLENTQLSATDKHNAIRDVVGKAVTALVSFGAVYDDTSNGGFRRSNGLAGGFTTGFARGVAGGITGFVAQMVKPGDTNIGGVNSDIYSALFQATYNAKILTGATYILDIAQAAGQAFGWVSGTPNSGAGAVAAAQIAAAIDAGGSGVLLANIRNAVDFGIDEAKGGTIVGNPARLPGAGAAGLRDLIANPLAPYYDHHSAQGRPVSNIFTL